MRYLCLLLVILVVWWYYRNDTIEGFWVYDKSINKFKKSKNRISGHTVKEESMAQAILSNNTMHIEMKTKNLEPQFLEQFKRLGWMD